MDDFELAYLIADKVKNAGGTAYYVGGLVRDKVMGKNDSASSDVDIEVHGITPDVLKNILSSFGNVRETGLSFGIYGIDGFGVDVAMPRTEKATGSGHRDFEVFVDPYIGTYKAAMRRDFTVNALMEDILTGEITDLFGGVSDVKNKLLRHVNDSSFPEDPLRVLRAARFAAVLDFTVAPETAELCKGMDLSALAKERVYAELEKALLKSSNPSVFFETLDKMNALSYWFPELEALKGIPQPEKHHPEGDVFIHTMCVLDAAAAYRDDAENKTGFMFSALCHDFGKAVCTEYESGNFHAIGHETKGLPLINTFIARLTSDKSLLRYVTETTALHMKPNIYAAAGSSVRSTNRLFDEAPSPSDLILLALSDITPASFLPSDVKHVFEASVASNKAFLGERLEKYREYTSRPCVAGSDLIEAGFTPGTEFSKMLSFAHKMQLSGIPKENVMKMILSGKY